MNQPKAMTNIRRYYRPGQLYFLTHVTHNREPLLVSNVDLWWKAISHIQEHADFDLLAWAILPDHLHLLVDPLKSDLSQLMKRTKLSFSSMLRKRLNLSSGRIWQYRYWDHIIRDDEDFRRHLDYIHYNPVKHGLVDSPSEYRHSSLSQFIAAGIYDENWAVNENKEYDGSFGE